MDPAQNIIPPESLPPVIILCAAGPVVIQRQAAAPALPAAIAVHAGLNPDPFLLRFGVNTGDGRFFKHAGAKIGQALSGDGDRFNVSEEGIRQFIDAQRAHGPPVFLLYPDPLVFGVWYGQGMRAHNNRQEFAQQTRLRFVLLQVNPNRVHGLFPGQKNGILSVHGGTSGKKFFQNSETDSAVPVSRKGVGIERAL